MVTKQLREFGLSQTIELFIDTNTITKFRFSDNLVNLDNALVTAIYVGDSGMLKSPSNKTVLDYGQMNSCYITLMGANGVEFNHRLPFEPFISSGVPYIFIKPKLISFRNSFVEFPDVASLVIPAGGYSIVFTVFYELYDPMKHKFDKSGELIEPEN